MKLYLRKINCMRISLWKLLLICVFFLSVLKFYQFLFNGRLTYKDLSSDEHLKLLELLTEKNSEILHLKAMLKKFKVPTTNYERIELPTLYIITPTYSRLVQKAELTRLKNVLLHVPNLHWIVVEDEAEKSKLLSNFLKTSGLNYTHLLKETPSNQKLQSGIARYRKPRGIHQRNAGIKWLSGRNLDSNGVVYFADDDNTYSIELFKEMRQTKKVGIWPVGLVGAVRAERPLVTNGKVSGWNVGWRFDRPFATDMAGFSVNLGLLMEKRALFTSISKIGFIETDFLQKLITIEELEPMADSCSKVLVWHTQSKEPSLKDEGKLRFNSDIEV